MHPEPLGPKCFACLDPLFEFFIKGTVSSVYICLEVTGIRLNRPRMGRVTLYFNNFFTLSLKFLLSL